MKQKPNTKPSKWDRKSTLGFIVVIGVFILIVMVLTVIPQYIRNYKVSKYDGQTLGTVLLIKANETQSQDFEGAKTVTPNYTVYFSYSVNGLWYQHSNVIQNQGIYKTFIHEIFISNYKKKIIIKYKRNNPNESLIVIEN